MKRAPSASRRSVRTRLARFADRCFDRLRHRAAFTVTERDAVAGTLDQLRGLKHAVLVTFRRTGEAVPSPVWFAIDENGHALVKTAGHAGKVQRIHLDDRALLAASTRRGKPTGQPIRCTARIVPPDEWDRAERLLAAAYGLGWTLSERLLGGAVEPVYLELRPRQTSGRVPSDGTAR